MIVYKLPWLPMSDARKKVQEGQDPLRVAAKVISTQRTRDIQMNWILKGKPVIPAKHHAIVFDHILEGSVV